MIRQGGNPFSNYPLTTLEGVVSLLQRTTQISGGGETAAQTTHIALLSIGEKRVELRLSTPPIIQDGDRVRLAGTEGNGVFTAIACRNLQTGWVSPLQNSGWIIGILVLFIATGLVFGVSFALIGGLVVSFITGKFSIFSLFFILVGFIVPTLAIWMLVKLKRNSATAKRAWYMVQ